MTLSLRHVSAGMPPGVDMGAVLDVADQAHYHTGSTVGRGHVKV